MNWKRWVDFIATTLFCAWVTSLFISCDPKLEPQNEETLPSELISIWKELKEKNLINGSIRIEQGDRVLFQDGPQQTPYAISSISKSFVGWRFLELQKDGLNLDSQVCHWLRNFCGKATESITLQMLLDHRAGFGRDLSLTQFLKRSLNPNWTTADIEDLVLEEDDLVATPGEKFLYSNFGYLVLSRLLEKIDNAPFGDIIQKMAIDTGLRHTRVIARHDVLPVTLLIPWTSVKIAFEADTILFRSAGAGGIASSPEDLAQWLKHRANEIERSFDGISHPYHQGWVRSQRQRFQAFWHNGASLGAYSLVAVLPGANIRVVIATNNFKPNKQWAEAAEQFEKLFY